MCKTMVLSCMFFVKLRLVSTDLEEENSVSEVSLQGTPWYTGLNLSLAAGWLECGLFYLACLCDLFELCVCALCALFPDSMLYYY